MVFFQMLVCFLILGMLLGFGLAVLPRRELLGRSVSPNLRWLLWVLPERALAVGWLLLAGTLLLRWGGTGTPGELVLGRCILLDLLSLGGMGVWAVRELRGAAGAVKKHVWEDNGFPDAKFSIIHKNILHIIKLYIFLTIVNQVKKMVY